MKTLLVAEKPSAAKQIKVGLEKYGKFSTVDWGYESEQYIVTWLVGHVLSLKQPKEYENWGGRWSLNILPWYPPNDTYLYKTNARTKDVYQKVSSFMKRKDVGLIINACDAEREGDLIFWELYDYLKLKTPVKRFWESAALKPSVVQRVIENELKDVDFYGPRKDAAYARAFADLLLGMNFTTAFTAKAKSLLHMGRVQTPTIGILVDRRKEIEAFNVESYFEIDVMFQNEKGVYKGTWFKDKLSNTRITKKEEADDIVSKVSGKIGTVTKKEVNEDKENHKLLYSLTTLQQDGIGKYGFTAKRVLEIAQSLYEKHQVLTYPRTESEVLGTEHISLLEPTLEAVSVGEYEPYAKKILADGIKTTKRFINDEQLTDHHAIIPMDMTPDLSALSRDEMKIYDLVVRRFLSVFYPAALYEKTEVITEVEGETFKTSGRVEIDPGWKVVYGGDDSDEEDKKKKEKKEDKLPYIELNEQPKMNEVKSNPKETKPPKYYTEKELLGIMKDPKKMKLDKELKEAMVSTGSGLGTPATRDNIIENIIARGYVQRKGKQLIATDLAINLIEVSPGELKSPEITADWEQKLKDISLGKLTMAQFMQDIKEYIDRNINYLKENDLSVSFQELKNAGQPTDYKCPKCGSPIVYKTTAKKINLYTCSKATKEEPCITVFETQFGRKLTKTQIKTLFEKGKTGVIEKLKGKSGKEFKAVLTFDLETLRIKPEFDSVPRAEVKKSNTTCPFCQKGVIQENSRAFGCSNWQEGCKSFTVWKNGTSITREVVEELINKGETKVLTLVGKDKKSYKVKYVLDIENKKIEREYVK